MFIGLHVSKFQIHFLKIPKNCKSFLIVESVKKKRIRLYFLHKCNIKIDELLLSKHMSNKLFLMSDFCYF